MAETVWIAVGAVTAALVAALISREIKISEFRQAWIDSLREDISLYVSKADEWISLYIEFNNEKEQSKKIDQAPHLDRLKYDSIHILRRIELRFKVDDLRGNRLVDNLWGLIDPAKLGRVIN